MTDLVTADCGVRQLQARFIDAVWRQDAVQFADCFTADGVWKIGGMRFTGREEIAGACRNMLGRCSHIQLVLMPAQLELTDEGALARHHVIEFARMNDGATAMTIGVYHDRLAEEGGLWRFRWRHWSMKYRGPSDLSGLFADTPDYGQFPEMPGDDEPTYVRPPA